MTYAAALRDELAAHKAAGREDRAAEVTAELRRLGELSEPERTTKPPATERATRKAAK